MSTLTIALLILGVLLPAGYFLPIRRWLAPLAAWLSEADRPGKVLFEDALKHIYECQSRRVEPTPQNLGGQLGTGVDKAAAIFSALQRRRLIRIAGSRIELTSEGRDYALHIIRAHRLWERYLADRTGVAETDWHAQAEQQEHRLSPREADALAASLGNPTHDPHGDPLPDASGLIHGPKGTPLLSLEEGQWGSILHVEDEPPSVYAHLVNLGFFPGMEFQVLSRSEDSVAVSIEGDARQVSLVAAANLTVDPSHPLLGPDFSQARRLSELRPGEKAKVIAVSRASRGTERRRFMDLGILPGTVIAAELVGPGGDPTAYRIKGALIALRREQADTIFVEQREETAA